MALNPTPEVLEALIRLRNTEPVVTKWLDERLQEHMKALVALSGEAEFRAAQGRAQEVSHILGTIQQASELLENLRRAQGTGKEKSW